MVIDYNNKSQKKIESIFIYSSFAKNQRVKNTRKIKKIYIKIKN